MADVIRGYLVNTNNQLKDINSIYVSGTIASGSGNYGLLVVQAPTSILYNGQKTVAAAGTAETLSGNTSIKSVCIKALPTNTNYVYVGNSSVTSSDGYMLPSGEAISMDIDNLNKIYLDVVTNGEGVSFLAVT